jgi:hypothetical protein
MTTGEKQRQRNQSDGSALLSPAHCKLLKERYGLSDETIDILGPISATQEYLTNLNFAPGVKAPGILLPILSPGRRKACDFLYRPAVGEFSPAACVETAELSLRKVRQPVRKKRTAR